MNPHTVTSLPQHGDPGLQPERTLMSWTRTGLAFCVAAALFVRFSWFFGVVFFAFTAITISVSVWIAAGQRRRYRRDSSGILTGALPPNIIGVAAVTIVLVALGIAAIALIASGLNT